uniref:hypothetical protein n=1 Tax=Hassallia byssoidea TaxID=482630 RepID=UPI0006948C65|nr:hypothetical protein [Hassalia byssoidea]
MESGEWGVGGQGGQFFFCDYQLPITDYQLPITNYRLPITNYQLPIAHCPLPNAPNGEKLCIQRLSKNIVASKKS